jgi:cation diffusion facilitator family transporter
MERAAEKRRVAAASVGAALLLTGTKLLVGWLTGSLGILSEAVHSGLDLLAAVITWVSVRVSDRPPDRDHPYGHGKIDNLSALIETALLLLACGWIVVEAIERLFVRQVAIEVTFWSFAVIAFAILVDLGRSRALSRVARRTGSAALEADALHFSSDVASSLVVIVGLALTRLGLPQADAVGAVGVSAIIVGVSVRLGRRSIDALLDRVPEDHLAKARAAARQIAGVRDVAAVRVRHVGTKHFVDLTVVLDPDTPLAGAHAVTERVETAIRAELDDADIVVHAEPDDPGNCPPR